MSQKTEAEIIAEKAQFMTELKTKIGEELATRGFATSADIKKEFDAKLAETFKDVPLDALRAMAKLDKDGQPEIMNMLAKQGAELLELQNRGGGKQEDLSIRGQVAAWRDVNKAALESIKAGTKAELTPLEIRVASPMTPSNTYNGSAYLPKIEYQAAPNEIVRVQPTFWDYLKKGATSTAAYVWVNKKNPLGAAGFIGPGVAKPGVSFEIETQISNAKKIAASEKVAIELLDDIDGFASWVEMELRYQVMQKINTTLMTGVASSTVPAGIQTLSTTFTLTGLSTTNANNFDAIRACVAQLRSGNLVGAVTVFVNPVDAANMDLSKAISSGVYILPPFTDASGKQVGGATVVEDNNVAVGYVQAAILDYYKILIYKGYTVTYGWENDDFTKNLVTVIGEMRLHQIFSTNFTGAFIYDTFDNIKTAITAP
jgi:hypothetical protein